MSKGCRIWLIIGLVVLALIIAGAIFLAISWEKIAVWGLEKTSQMSEQKILANLPEGIDKDDVTESFEM
jgi:hypothetical protein